MGDTIKVYALSQGQTLVKAAREVIKQRFISDKPGANARQVLSNGFDQMNGLFVTLERYPSKALRGCVGFPRAVAPVRESLPEAALCAAFEDPRFPPVTAKELDTITVEISVLSSPTLIEGNPSDRAASVKVGRDGLIIEYSAYSGILLPIVPVEQGWDEARFLAETCIKAGLPENYWTLPNPRLYKFESQVFREETPSGKAVEVDLAGIKPEKVNK